MSRELKFSISCVMLHTMHHCRTRKQQGENMATTANFREILNTAGEEATAKAHSDAKPLEVTESRDTLLIRRVLAGDTEAFYALVKPYQRMLFASAIAMLNNEADAE